MYVHRNRNAVSAHIFEQKLSALRLAQMIVDNLTFIRKLPSQTLFLNPPPDFLVIVVGFNQVKVIPDRLDAIKVVGVSSVDDLAISEMHLVPTIRYIVCKLERDHIA